MKANKEPFVKWDRSVIVAYHDIETEIPIFNTRSQIVGHQSYTMRLPYTAKMLERRAARLAEVGKR